MPKSSVFLASEQADLKLNLHVEVFAIIQSISGPIMIFPQDFSIEELKIEQNAIQVASLFSLALGQGSHYNVGFFGPLPILDLPFKAYLFSGSMPDHQIDDPRMKGHNYVILGLLVPRDLQLERFPGTYAEVSQTTENYFNKIRNVAFLTSKTLQKFLVQCQIILNYRDFEIW